MTLQNLDMETLVQLNTLLQNNESESESEYEEDEFLSEYDDYDDDDEFDDYDEDEDEFDDDETAEFDDYDDDDEIFRWIKRGITKRRDKRLIKRGWRRPAPKVRRIPKRRPTVARVNNYASMTDLNSLISSTNKRIGALKRTTSINARANSRNARVNAQLRRKLKAAEDQQRMTAMMTMLSPPQVKSIAHNTSTTNQVGSNTISLDEPEVKFKTNPLALLSMMGSSGGNMQSILPLILLTQND